MKPALAQVILRWLLVITGCGLMVAFVFVLLPTAVLGAIHRWLGLGEFPSHGIVVYLARSTSLLYGVHGVLMFLVGRNLHKLSSLIPVFGYLHILIGTAMFAIDLGAGLPFWWTAGEGAPVALTGLVIVWLNRQAFADPPSAD